MAQSILSDSDHSSRVCSGDSLVSARFLERSTCEATDYTSSRRAGIGWAGFCGSNATSGSALRLAIRKRWVWLMWVGLIGYGIWAVLEIQSWWIPWIFGADQRALNNQKFLQRTYKIFPSSIGHRRNALRSEPASLLCCNDDRPRSLGDQAQVYGRKQILMFCSEIAYATVIWLFGWSVTSSIMSLSRTPF